MVQLREDFEDIDTDETAEHCRASIAGYKIPRSIVVPAITNSEAPQCRAPNLFQLDPQRLRFADMMPIVPAHAHAQPLAV